MHINGKRKKDREKKINIIIGNTLLAISLFIKIRLQFT